VIFKETLGVALSLDKICEQGRIAKRHLYFLKKTIHCCTYDDVESRFKFEKESYLMGFFTVDRTTW
jgi:hypothetical protein